MIPAIFVAYSRIYIGSHYPSDVVVGAVLAVGLSLLAIAFAEGIWRRLAPKVVPKLAERHPSLFA